MSSGSTSEGVQGDELVVVGDELFFDRFRVLVHERPLLAVAAGGALGAVFGGILFSRLGRLLFIAAAGYVANELWHREGRLDIDHLVQRLGSPPQSGGATITPPQSGGATITPPQSGGAKQ
jgi:hypothetical protein